MVTKGWCCFDYDLEKNGAARGSEVVRVQPASQWPGNVVGLTAGEHISLELGFCSRQTDVCLGRRSRNDSFWERDLDLRTSFVVASLPICLVVGSFFSCDFEFLEGGSCELRSWPFVDR